jgi:hypothetical protein
MTPIEVAGMLAAVSTLDGRVPESQAAVEAWRAVLDGDMQGDFAMSYVRQWYGNKDEPLTPASLNKAWREHRRVETNRRAIKDRPEHLDIIKCPFPDCVCTHDNGCVAGWMDKQDGPTRPCPVCRPGLSDILTEIPAPGSRSASDSAAIREGRSSRWSNGLDKA